MGLKKTVFYSMTNWSKTHRWSHSTFFALQLVM